MWVRSSKPKPLLVSTLLLSSPLLIAALPQPNPPQQKEKPLQWTDRDGDQSNQIINDSTAAFHCRDPFAAVAFPFPGMDCYPSPPNPTPPSHNTPPRTHPRKRKSHLSGRIATVIRAVESYESNRCIFTVAIRSLQWLSLFLGWIATPVPLPSLPPDRRSHHLAWPSEC